MPKGFGESLGDLIDDFCCLFYSPPKSKKVEKRGNKLKKLKPKQDDNSTPLRATEEDLKEGLKVTSIDLKIPDNTENHHTEAFACTQESNEDEKPVDDDDDGPELVVRRGQAFNIGVTFESSYDVNRDDLLLVFKTGKFAKRHPETYGRMELDETGNAKRCSDGWSCHLIGTEGCTLNIEVHPPANIAIGEWSFSVITKTRGQKKTLCYEHKHNIFMLFNPWCKDDDVYLSNEDEREEYVLNDHGIVFRGNKLRPQGKNWNFGQFEDGILEAALFVIMKCFTDKTLYRLSDPVRVARVIAQVVNCCDSDKGILWGRWSGKYEDGCSPMDWYGSVRIIKQYIEQEKPVQYGQCWVFSGVTVTVCRAIGIPARSVTNYGSAHDTDSSLTIDKYFKRNDKGALEPDSNLNSDSVWNYHVWNEVWMKREDIKLTRNNTCDFDGWQAIDATPQEASDGKYTCGPCPVYAIKTGQVNIPYDCGFVFAEVNADIVHWEPVPEGHRKFKLRTNKVGKSISTKAIGGIFSNRCDITENYKFEEGSEDNRKAVLRASLVCGNSKDVYGDDDEADDIDFELINDPEPPLGQDLEIELKAVNKSENKRKVTSVVFSVYPQTYTGTCYKAMKTESLTDDVKLSPGQEHVFKTTLKLSDYIGEIDSGRSISIQAYAFVKASSSRPIQNCVKSHDVEFSAPTLEVKMPECVKRGEEFEACVTFTNPLQEELTECKAGYEGRGFKHVTGEPQDNVPVTGKFEKVYKLKTKTKGNIALTFKFTSKQLHYISGAGKVKVE